jgi:flagellar biosynthesis chaperone FliJ
MADLEPLIRVKRHTVDEKQKIVAEIFRQIEVVEYQKKELLERLKKEREALDQNDMVETRAYYGRFEGVIRSKVATLEGEMRKLETRLSIAQEEVRSAFADMKRIEIVYERRQEEEKQALKDKETKELDEIGIEGFRRQEEL